MFCDFMCKFIKIFPLLTLILAFQANAAINMAVIAPRAGELKGFGDELINGVKIAVDDINSRGGVQGEPINLLIVDDQCDDRIAISTAQMMAVNSSEKDKMNLVVGPYCGNAFDKVTSIYAKANIFQIIPTTISPSNAKNSHGGLVKMVGSTSQQGEDFFKYYEANFAGSNVALVYDDAMRNIVEIAAAVQNEFHKNEQADKIKIFNFVNYDDMTQMARDIHSQGVNVAYILGNSKNIAKLSKALKKEDENITLFANRYQTQDNYQDLMGDLAEGSYLVALPSLKNSPSFTETLVRLRLQGHEPEGLGVYSYSAVKLWEDLVGKASSFKYADLAKALNNNRFETAWGEMLFTNGNPEKSISYGIYKLQEGEYTQVY